MTDTLRRWRDALAGYWFAPQPVTDLALLRIALVAVLLARLPSLTVAHMLGADGPHLAGPVLPALRIATLPIGGLGGWDMGTLGPLAWWTAVIAGAAAIAGLFTRVAVALCCWGLVVLEAALYSRAGAINHDAALALIALGLLTCTPCGAAWSLDRWIARRRGRPPVLDSPDARWPLVTVQWLLALTYLSAALSKLGRGGLAWFAPATVQYYLVQDGLIYGNEIGLAAARFPTLAMTSAVFAVAFEGFFWTGLVWRRTLPFLLLAGAAMHTGIYVLQRANFAEYAALALVFIDPLRRVAADWATRRRTAPTRAPRGERRTKNHIAAGEWVRDG